MNGRLGQPWEGCGKSGAGSEGASISGRLNKSNVICMKRGGKTQAPTAKGQGGEWKGGEDARLATALQLHDAIC